MKRFIYTLAALALGTSLSAQNINQTVQVTNDYVTRFADFQKQGAELKVPDSLYRFDYRFDYSVFETPYKGSYEFVPYRIQVTPQARLYDGSKLYLRAGAGLSLHPQLEFAAQLLQEKDFTIGVFADGGGYFGNYYGQDGNSFRGHDLSARVAVNGQRLMKAVRLSYELAYDGIFAGETGDNPAFRSGFNSAYAMARVQSRELPKNQLFYDLDLRFRYSGDSYPASMKMDNVGESDLRVALSLGPELQQKYKILIDGIFEMASLRSQDTMFGGAGATTNLSTLRPHLDFQLGPVRLDAGVRMDFSVWGNDRSDIHFTLAPDVTARFALLEADLELFAGVSGGQRLEDHYTLKQLHHFLPRGLCPAKISREKLRIRAGVEGHWGSRLQYAVEGGWASLEDTPVATYGSIVFPDARTAYGQASLQWEDERLQLDGRLRYAWMDFTLDGIGGFFYVPAAFTADVRGSWNWDRRIFVGAFVEAASARGMVGPSPTDSKIPAYANLGLTGEYRFNRWLGVWAEGGNLLGMEIQRTPGYAEKGPYFTLGLRLKL